MVLHGTQNFAVWSDVQQIIAICKARVKLEPLEVLAEEGKGLGPALRQLHRIQVGSDGCWCAAGCGAGAACCAGGCAVMWLKIITSGVDAAAVGVVSGCEEWFESQYAHSHLQLALVGACYW